MRTDVEPELVREVLLREGASLVAHGLLYPFGYLKSHYEPRRQKDQHTVVFVHGLKGNRSNFFPMQAYLKAKGHKRQLAFNHKSGPSIETLAMQLREVIDSEVKGGSVDIIAHSMGGLIARFYLQMLGGQRRVQRLITLGTPHQGTWASRMIPSRLLSQMSPDGPFLDDLNAATLNKTRVFSAAAGNDALIVPARNALYPNEDSRLFDGLGHTSMMLAPSVLRFVDAALKTPLH